jgi:hypothetical protein
MLFTLKVLTRVYYHTPPPGLLCVKDGAPTVRLALAQGWGARLSGNGSRKAKK